MEQELQKYWQKIYQSKKNNEVSWYEESPDTSLNLIKAITPDKDQAIIDIGAGASNLLDKLLEQGFQDLTALDISEKALYVSKERLGQDAASINWVVADIIEFEPKKKFYLWHDRAMFHFLTDPPAIKRYKQVLNQSLVDGGYLILASFAIDGPSKCSELEVKRYDAKGLQIEFSDNFTLLQSLELEHLTPWNTKQKFLYCLFQKKEEV